MTKSHVYVYGKYMRRSLEALCGSFDDSVRKKISSKSPNCSERVEFKDGSAASLAAGGSKSLHYTFFYSGKFTSPSLTIAE